MNHRVGAAQGFAQAFAADQIAVAGFDPGRQLARSPAAAHQRTHTGAAGCQPIQQMCTDEAGTASDQDHYCRLLRKATSPK